MKLKEYVKRLKKIEKEFGDLDLIYAVDDEGNSFQKVYLTPTLVKNLSPEKTYLVDEDLDFDKDPDTLIIN